MIRDNALAAVRGALCRVERSNRREIQERLRNFAGQGYAGEDLLRRVAGIPLARECGHPNQPGPWCGLCGGPL